MIKLSALADEFHVPESGLRENYVKLLPYFGKENSLEIIKSLLSAHVRNIDIGVDNMIKNK